MLGGGFLGQSANLVEGAPGTGKSTLGMQYIYNGIAQFNQPGLILTFEEFAQQYYDDAANFGWDFRALEQASKLRVIMTSRKSAILIWRRGWTHSGHDQRDWRPADSGRQPLHFDRLSDDPVVRRGILYGFINS